MRGAKWGEDRVPDLGKEVAAVQIMLSIPYPHRSLPEPFGSSLIRLLNMHCNILLVVSFSLLFSFKETTRRICAHFTRLLIKCPHLQKYTSGQFLTKSHIITTLHASLFCPYLHLQQLLSRIFNGLKTGLAPIRTHRPLNFTLNPLILGLVHNDKILSATNPLSGRG